MRTAKRIKSKAILLLVFTLLLISWQKRNSVSGYFRLLEVIDITPALDKGSPVMASEIYSDFRYIELETTDESMIRSVRDIVAFKGNIFIETSGKVLRFDSSGRFLNTIGAVGRGPGEFSASNIYLNILRDQNQIAVADHGMRRINIYEFDGRHITSFNVDCYPYFTASINNNLLSYTGWGHAQFSNNFAISVTSLKGKASGNLLPVLENIPRTGMAVIWRDITGGFYYLGDSLTLRDANVDTIYRVIAKDKIMPRYYLSAGRKHLTWDKRYNTSDPDRSLRKGSIYFNSFVETRQHIYLGARVFDVMEYFIYYKSGKEVRKITPGAGPAVAPSIRGLTNDIDGGLSFWPTGQFSDKELFCFFEPRFLRGHFKNIAAVPQKQKFNLEKHSLLKERVGKADINSNPWIMVATLK